MPLRPRDRKILGRRAAKNGCRELLLEYRHREPPETAHLQRLRGPAPACSPPNPRYLAAATGTEDLLAGSSISTEDLLAGSSISTEDLLAGSSISTEDLLAGSSISTRVLLALALPTPSPGNDAACALTSA